MVPLKNIPIFIQNTTMKKITIILLITVACFNSVKAQDALGSKTKAKDAALETLGATSAMLLYNTYICIGSIADGYDKVSTKETVSTLLGEQSNGINVIVTNYKKLLDSGFLESEDDKAFIRKAIKCAGHLQEEANAFKNYVETKNKSDITKYDTARNNAWSIIEDLLGLKK
ncbi:MAG: hypothetical protein K0S32_267 [Bacteroidetes bacterium]|jgi:hypothetical protein|nr:hypothetical protein [Bacteroidota bacterium]